MRGKEFIEYDNPFDVGMTGLLGFSSGYHAMMNCDVLLMIVKQGSVLILLGLGIGLIGAYALTRVISSLLFGVTAKDPFTFGAVAVLLAIVALLACYIPALRATKVDPMNALRCE